MLSEGFGRALAQHVTWKVRLRNAIDRGECDRTPEQLRADDLCEFGMWLRSPDFPPALNGNSRYALVVELHAAFHIAAADVLRLALSGDKQAAEDAMATGSDYSLTSAQLVNLLNDMATELRS
jgi:hypothetical protein